MSDEPYSNLTPQQLRDLIINEAFGIVQRLRAGMTAKQLAGPGGYPGWTIGAAGLIERKTQGETVAYVDRTHQGDYRWHVIDQRFFPGTVSAQ